MRNFFMILTLALTISSTAFAQNGHEYAPIQEAEITYKNWQLPVLGTDRSVDLREFAEGKKLVLVVYFAPWCGNWRYEAPVLSRLYEKYKEHGFDIVAVSEYAPADETRAYVKEAGTPYTVVVDSVDRAMRDKTAHYGYRKATGDTRTWGSPYNVFLVPSTLQKSGETLTSKAWVVNGELIEAEAEAFIRKQLGLPSEAAASTGSDASQGSKGSLP